MKKFGLALARREDPMLPFGRFAREDAAKYGAKPETFEFLGFKHVCGMDRNGKTRRCPHSEQEELQEVPRPHPRVARPSHALGRRDQQRHLASMLRGFYQYFALDHCMPKLYWVLGEVRRQWRRSMRRCGQRRGCSGGTSKADRGSSSLIPNCSTQRYDDASA